MPERRTSRTLAVVTSRFRLGEADRVVTLLSPDRGKFKAIAKGVRKPTSRLGGGVEPFAELEVALAAGRTFDIVTQVRSRRIWLARTAEEQCRCVVRRGARGTRHERRAA